MVEVTPCCCEAALVTIGCFLLVVNVLWIFFGRPAPGVLAVLFALHPLPLVSRVNISVFAGHLFCPGYCWVLLMAGHLALKALTPSRCGVFVGAFNIGGLYERSDSRLPSMSVDNGQTKSRQIRGTLQGTKRWCPIPYCRKAAST